MTIRSLTNGPPPPDAAPSAACHPAELHPVEVACTVLLFSLADGVVLHFFKILNCDSDRSAKLLGDLSETCKS